MSPQKENDEIFNVYQEQAPPPIKPILFPLGDGFPDLRIPQLNVSEL